MDICSNPEVIHTMDKIPYYWVTVGCLIGIAFCLGVYIILRLGDGEEKNGNRRST